MLKRNLYSLIASVLLLSGCNFLPMNNNVGSNNNSINNDNILYQYEDIVEGQVVEGAYSQFVNINVLSSYLGYGYDVVNDPYMDKDYINMSAPIIDMDKIKDAKLKMIKENNQDVDNYSGSDFVEFSEDYSNGFNIDVGSNLKKIKFSGSVNTSFNCKGKEQTYMKFQKSVYKVNSFNLYLTDSLNTIKNMISDEFLEDVDQLTAKSLFNKYGTHLIKEVAMGGRVETDSIWYSNTVGYSEDVEFEVEAHASILKNIAKLDAKLNSESTTSLNKKGIKYEERLDSIGGPALNISTSATVAEGMNAWLEKLDNDLSVSALSGIVGENSLIPLWDLIPDTDYEKREELQRVFNEQCAENYDAICDIYKLNKNRDVRIICDETQGAVLGNESPYIDGDTVALTAKPNSGYMFDGWYIEDEMVSNKTTYSFDIHINTTLEARFKLSENSGEEPDLPEEPENSEWDGQEAKSFKSGIGTPTDPYIVENPGQYNYISTYLSKRGKGYFKIEGDLDFKGFSIKSIDKLDGIIDGQGHYIYNFTADSAFVNENQGTIKNIHYGKEGNDSIFTQTDVKQLYTGIVTNINYGEILNCEVSNLEIINKNNGNSNKHIYGNIAVALGGFAGLSMNDSKIAKCCFKDNNITGVFTNKYSSRNYCEFFFVSGLSACNSLDFYNPSKQYIQNSYYEDCLVINNSVKTQKNPNTDYKELIYFMTLFPASYLYTETSWDIIDINRINGCISAQNKVSSGVCKPILALTTNGFDYSSMPSRILELEYDNIDDLYKYSYYINKTDMNGNKVWISKDGGIALNFDSLM